MTREEIVKALRAKAHQSSTRRNQAGGLSRNTDHVCWIAADLIERQAKALGPFATLYSQIMTDHGPDWFADEGQVMRAALAYPVANNAVVWRHFRLAAEAFTARAALEEG